VSRLHLRLTLRDALSFIHYIDDEHINMCSPVSTTIHSQNEGVFGPPLFSETMTTMKIMVLQKKIVREDHECFFGLRGKGKKEVLAIFSGKKGRKTHTTYESNSARYEKGALISQMKKKSSMSTSSKKKKNVNKKAAYPAWSFKGDSFLGASHLLRSVEKLDFFCPRLKAIAFLSLPFHPYHGSAH